MELLILAIFGLIVGSFLNVVIWRLSVGEKLTGRSRCRHCHQQLYWYHNIPLVSFFYLRSRCAFCRQPISWQYPLVEAVTAVWFALGAVLIPGGQWLMLLTYLVLVSYLIVLFVFDWQYMILPDSLTLSGTVVLLILNLLIGRSWLDLVVGAAVGAGWFALQYYWSRGRWVGAGDIRFGLLMGVALGWRYTIMALIIAYWLGAVVALIMLALKRARRDTQLPFGTFLAVATWLVFVGGSLIWQWYGAWLGL